MTDGSHCGTTTQYRWHTQIIIKRSSGNYGKYGSPRTSLWASWMGLQILALQDQKRVGIGGFLLDKHNRRRFIFSGPSPFLSPQQTEEYALQFMLEAINHKDLQNLRAIIASDSSALVNTYSNFHYPSGTIHPISQLPTRLPYLKLVHINRGLSIKVVTKVEAIYQFVHQS